MPEITNPDSVSQSHSTTSEDGRVTHTKLSLTEGLRTLFKTTKTTDKVDTEQKILDEPEIIATRRCAKF